MIAWIGGVCQISLTLSNTSRLSLSSSVVTRLSSPLTGRVETRNIHIDRRHVKLWSAYPNKRHRSHKIYTTQTLWKTSLATLARRVQCVLSALCVASECVARAERGHHARLVLLVPHGGNCDRPHMRYG